MATQAMSCKERVLKTLRTRKWIPGTELTRNSIGGTGGLRRLRELREEGYKIEGRPMPHSRTFEYKLVKSPR